MKGTKNNMKFKQNMYIYIHIKRYMDNPVNMNVNLNRHMDLNVIFLGRLWGREFSTFLFFGIWAKTSELGCISWMKSSPFFWI